MRSAAKACLLAARMPEINITLPIKNGDVDLEAVVNHLQ